jgi:hypothetical protein
MGVSWLGCCEPVFLAACVEHAVVRTIKNAVAVSALFNSVSPSRVEPLAA